MMVRTLLWKDFHVNRLALIIGLVLLVGPMGVGGIINVYADWRYDKLVWGWQRFLISGGVTTLGISLLSIAILAGNAVAAERMDRSAEFLAYLPPSRLSIITSKIILALGCSALVWLFGTVAVYVIPPLLGEIPEHLVRFRGDAFPIFSFTAILLFGAAWLATTFLDSPTIAAAIGIATPILVFALLAVLKYHFAYEFNIYLWYRRCAVIPGILLFFVGTVYFIRRTEP